MNKPRRAKASKDESTKVSKANRTRTPKRADAELALEHVQNAQDAYWAALTELEDELGIDMDGTRDFQGMTLDDLLEAEEDEDDDTEVSNG